jgi:vacuolar-type H+-ATPase subunit I/STV1
MLMLMYQTNKILIMGTNNEKGSKMASSTSHTGDAQSSNGRSSLDSSENGSTNSIQTIQEKDRSDDDDEAKDLEQELQSYIELLHLSTLFNADAVMDISKQHDNLQNKLQKYNKLRDSYWGLSSEREKEIANQEKTITIQFVSLSTKLSQYPHKLDSPESNKNPKGLDLDMNTRVEILHRNSYEHRQPFETARNIKEIALKSRPSPPSTNGAIQASPGHRPG